MISEASKIHFNTRSWQIGSDKHENEANGSNKHGESAPSLIAPSKSPDILVAFFSAPHRPVFGDFVFSSPRSSDKTCHSQAAQVACNSKHADYSKHHDYPSDVFFPLAAERSGYLHPTFVGFIDTFLAQCSSTPLQPSAKLGVYYSIGHSITYMTASFLKAASFSLTPSSLKSLFPPPPFILPLRWAPGFLFRAPRHRAFGSAPHSTGHSRRRASSKAAWLHVHPSSPVESLSQSQSQSLV